MTRLSIFITCLILLFVSTSPNASAQTTRTVPQDTPELVALEKFTDLAVSDGLLYWPYQDCPEGRTANSAMLKRKPTAGGATTFLASHSDCETFQFMQLDETGLYYHNEDQQRIEFIPIDLSSAPQTIGSVPGVGAALAIDDSSIYYARSTGGIYRLPKSGGTATLAVSTGVAVQDMLLVNDTLYWTENSGLRSATFPCLEPCTGSALSTATGDSLLFGPAAAGGINTAVYFVEQAGAVSRIRRFTCSGVIGRSCSTTTLYTAPSGFKIGEISLISTTIFNPFPIAEFSLVFAERNLSTEDGRIQRKPLDDSAADELYPTTSDLTPHIVTHAGYIYFGEFGTTQDTIYRLPINAAPVERDVSAEAIEVTQAVQNLANDVPLVADKPTFVRVYGGQSAGPRAGTVEAHLVGTRGGNPLPGSPLQPINGTQRLSTSFNFDRADLEDGWLFQLPASWTEGTSNLQAVVNPRSTFVDTNSADNTISLTATFNAEPNACVLFTPVETHTPLPQVGDPNFWESVDLATRLWPVPGMTVHWLGEPVRELQVCTKFGVPYPCYGPYEMEQGSSITNFPSDENRVIGKLMLRQIAFSAAAITADICQDDASLHTVGMVHPQAPTQENNNRLGLGNYYISASWVKFTDHAQTGPTGNDPAWTFPTSGATLAHEMTHNFNRRHVNCGNPDDLDNNYPYPPCQIDNAGASNHYGFDPASLSPIAPTMAADYMSYSSRKWVSDYTYEAVMGQFGRSNRAVQALRGSAEMVTISGFVDDDDALGKLNYAYALSTTTLQDDALAVYAQYQTDAYDAQRSSGYHVQFKDGSGVVHADLALPLEFPNGADDEDSVAPFFLTLPAPSSPIATIDLLHDTTVLDTLTPGANAPTVNIISPPPGGLFSDTFTIEWSATDADSADTLRYNVDYSDDGGTSWYPLVTDFAGAPDENVRLVLQNPFSTPGSDMAQIRVVASDGYNTTIATSGIFTVGDRTPIAGITSPAANAWIAAGESVILSGSALDAEDGMLTALTWSLDGNALGGTNDIVLNGLTTGEHTVQLIVEDSAGNQATVERTFYVAPVNLPVQTSTPSLDGTCDDSAYQNGVALSLFPYLLDDNTQATATLLRRTNAWYVCLTGLPTGSDALLGQAGIYIDLGADGGNTPQTGDFAFLVDEAGTPSAMEGNGTEYSARTVAGLETRVAGDASMWSAELRIDPTIFGTLPPAAGIVVGHSDVDFTIGSYFWPFSADVNIPATYAYTILDTPPTFDTMTPTTALVGTSGVQLAITGTNFISTTRAAWNGALLSTTVNSTTELVATVESAQLATAGLAQITVVDANFANAPVAPQSFTVRYPLPTLTTVTPQTLTQAQAETITITGADFVADAQILLDGAEVATTFVSSAQLTGVVAADLLTQERDSNLVVVNPSPGGGSSNILTVTVESNVPTAITLVAAENEAQTNLTMLLVVLFVVTLGIVAVRKWRE